MKTETKKAPTTTPAYIEEIKAAIKSKILFIHLTTREEQRAERDIISLAVKLQFMPLVWTVTEGVIKPATDNSSREERPELADLNKLFEPDYLNQVERRLYIMKDAASYTDNAVIKRLIRDEMSRSRKRKPTALKCFVFIDTETAPDIPGFYKMELPLPERQEVENILNVLLEALPDEKKPDAETVAGLMDALTGLDSETIRDALNKSMVIKGKPDPLFIAQNKKQLVSSDAVSWIDPDPRGMDAIGGLDVLKSDLIKFKAAFSPDAAEYGLPAPKGSLIVGIPGSGKSLTAKCIAAAWNLPLVQLNVASLFGKYVGDTEKQTRAAFNTIEALAPVIVWIDELEKALAGSSGSGDTDGGTATRLLGQFLTFTQERPTDKKIFLIATANNVNALPPELKRAGRWDRIYFVDAPNKAEREEISRVMMRKYPRCKDSNPEDIAESCTGFTGAEIEAAFQTALYTAYNDNKRNPTTTDIIEAFKEITPIAKAEEKNLSAARQWAEGTARRASTPDNENEASAGTEFVY